MTAKAFRVIGVTAFGIAMSGAIVVLNCNCAERPDVRASHSEQEPAPQVAPEPANQPQQHAEPAPDETTAHEPNWKKDDLLEPDEREKEKLPELPPYVAVVETIDPYERSQVALTLTKPRTLEVETTNIKRIQFTRKDLPLASNRSIVLRIDNQGIEWTVDTLAVELERSPAGEWVVVRTKPTNP